MDERLRLGTQNRRREEYVHFSEAEMDRRRAAVREMMDEQGVEALVLYGTAGFEGEQIEYLTNYAPSFATYVVFHRDPEAPTSLLVGISNHVQYVREVADVDDIEVMLHDPPGTLAARLEGVDSVGIVGFDPRYELSMPYPHFEALRDDVDAGLVDVTAPYTAVYGGKSDEELERVREAARILDACMEAFEAALEPGVTERELGHVLARTAMDEGGAPGIDFVTSAPMEGAEPGEPLTWHHPSNRTIREGDMVTTEISALSAGYQSQIHRPYTVGASPTDTYRELFDLASEAYEDMVAALRPGNTLADVHAALAPIEESEHKIYDVMLHGYGNGYVHPFVGTEASNYWPGAEDPLTAEWELEAGQVLVVQPNVVTRDERCGLQFGTTVVVDDSPEVLQEYPAEFIEV
jgi:Xaa-Pro aminopeptidase